MRLTFLGANNQVTGSRYCLEAAGRKLLIDCGLFQEREYLARNWEPCPVPASDFDAVLLTHVHIDHCGLVPRFVHDGFDKTIYATRPSVDLSGIMLRDTAHIQMEDAAYKRRRHQKEGRRGKFPEVPLYTITDVDKALPLFHSVKYGDRIEIGDSISAVFHDAGHILGSSMIEVVASENGTTRRFLFSGDVGQWDKPLLRDPTLFDQADYVIVESTYGDRDHERDGDLSQRLAEIVNHTTRRGGNIVIPVFALERAQELMYCLSQLVHHDRIPDIPIYLDSPMAVEVTNVFRRYEECFDAETQELLERDESPLEFPGLKFARTTEESKAINGVLSPSIIMSASGMCNAGRIKHHLRYNIGRHECTILFVGYQGRGTLGRHILEGAREVRIHGKTHRVEAHIEQLHGFSGHADRTGLLRWLGHLKTPPRHVFVTHGEAEASTHFAQRIKSQWAWPVSVPEYGARADLE